MPSGMPREWERLYPMPLGCPIAPLLQWRPRVLFEEGVGRVLGAPAGARGQLEGARVQRVQHACSSQILLELFGLV